MCEQSVKCTQDEMHTRLQVHSSTAYQLGPGRVLVEMPTVTSCNSRAPAPDCATRDISVLLGLWLSHYSSPSPSPALPAYPHVSLSLPVSGKRLYLVAARTGLWVALPLAESGLTLSRRRIRREESNELFFEKPGRRLSMIPGPAGRGWREGLAGVRKRRQAGSG